MRYCCSVVRIFGTQYGRAKSTHARILHTDVSAEPDRGTPAAISGEVEIVVPTRGQFVEPPSQDLYLPSALFPSVRYEPKLKVYLSRQFEPLPAPRSKEAQK